MMWEEIKKELEAAAERRGLRFGRSGCRDFPWEVSGMKEGRGWVLCYDLESVLDVLSRYEIEEVETEAAEFSDLDDIACLIFEDEDEEEEGEKEA